MQQVALGFRGRGLGRPSTWGRRHFRFCLLASSFTGCARARFDEIADLVCSTIQAILPARGTLPVKQEGALETLKLASQNVPEGKEVVSELNMSTVSAS
jgi:hypothetical protein